MDLIQLKVPPDRLEIMADAIERDLKSRPEDQSSKDLRDVLIWLRFRHAKWAARRRLHPRR